jgi:hypothetical protein
MGRGWGGDGDEEISLPATWNQGGRDPITARRVTKEVKGNRRKAKGNQQGGSKKARGLRHVMLLTYMHVHNNCL